ncbi:galactokinase [Pullulanibacillus camelliae]|uniref:Galactokinase n=1 Tax=Pullulanibacillus camelliae TaxID=1707096 RepID=A0A8J2YIV4_9BACL|nr:galactokinase [Pullulanibacillus camelliae]GGE45444.1 galactokinase [Pullulanibacillus camelliae]
MEQQLFDRFHHYFPGNNDDIRVYFAPGRVNLIGEHTDYNGGYVLPSALSIGTYMLIRSRKDGAFRLRSENFKEHPVDFSLNELVYIKEDDWGNYPKGIIHELMAEGVPLTGADILYYGNIPNGAGLSSSASIGMVTAYGLSKLAKFPMDKQQLAFLCQRMENHFIGVNTGIMDQFAVGLAEKNHALFLNCDTLEKEKVALNLGSYKLLITNTNKRRGLADSKYNERLEECREALKILQGINSKWTNLSQVPLSDFEANQDKLTPILRARARHVITENARVLQAVRCLQAHDLSTFGKLMEASHVSLRDDYEVTGKELDALFEAQRAVKGCIGTRMTGAGFGGCTVSIVHEKSVEAFKTTVQRIYKQQTGLEADFYICDTGDGVTERTEEVRL